MIILGSLESALDYQRYWTFFLGVTAEAIRANIGSKSAISLQRGLADPKFQVEGVAPRTILLFGKLGGDFSCGIKIWTHHSFVLSQITRLTDGQTDGETVYHPWTASACIPCSAVKSTLNYTLQWYKRKLHRIMMSKGVMTVSCRKSR